MKNCKFRLQFPCSDYTILYFSFFTFHFIHLYFFLLSECRIYLQKGSNGKCDATEGDDDKEERLVTNGFLQSSSE